RLDLRRAETDRRARHVGPDPDGVVGVVVGRSGGRGHPGGEGDERRQQRADDQKPLHAGGSSGKFGVRGPERSGAAFGTGGTSTFRQEPCRALSAATEDRESDETAERPSPWGLLTQHGTAGARPAA